MEAAKCAAFLLLSLVSCLETLSIEGRPFSMTNKASIHDAIEASPKRELGDEGSSQQQHTNPNHIASPMTPQKASNEDAFRPTTPGSSPGVGHKFSKSREQSEAKHKNPNNVASPMTPQSAFKDAFRPTTPGNSPGAGHKFGKSREQSEAEGRNLVPSKATEDYRPTTPGHSPGVGHKLQVENAKPSP